MTEPSIALRCHALAGLFEAELLVELMLRYWIHPFADDADFRNHLLESSVEILKHSIAGQELLEGIPPNQVNLVMAVWFAEWTSISDSSAAQIEARRAWLDKVKRSIPSCFADQKYLE